MQKNSQIPMTTFTFNELKAFWGIESDEVVGQFVPYNEAHGFLNYLVGFDSQGKEHRLLHPITKVGIGLPVSHELHQFKDRSKYRVLLNLRKPRIMLTEGGKIPFQILQIREEKEFINSHSVVSDNLSGVGEMGSVSPKEHIRDLFMDRGESPNDADRIASQLKLNEVELYAHPERFVFELLQNADDMPQKGEKVSVKIQLLTDFLLFLHTGNAFEFSDIEAVCNAAKSNKVSDGTKTGYKGIGFKSVFSDSEKVFIRSGQYSFRFDRDFEAYKDFWLLYKDHYETKSIEAKLKFKKKFEGKEHDYTHIERIPWQIKPIWTDPSNYPTDLAKTDFVGKYPVSIALEVGKGKIKDRQYSELITNVVNQPRFLLFLRNVTALEFYDRSNSENPRHYKLKLEEDGDSVSVVSNANTTCDKYLRHQTNVLVTNEAFENANFKFSKKDSGEKVIFINEEGVKIENIPEKLGTLTVTKLTFAGQIIREKIERLSVDRSIIFNYLPTTDTRFGFPFLVNADFVMNSARELVQFDNRWNHYLMYNIGYNLLGWLTKLAHKFPESYLNLLPLTLLDETTKDAGKIYASFNWGVHLALSNTAFILNELNELSRCEDIVLDKTGLARHLGNTFFHEYTGLTDKLLPTEAINNSHLESDYLGIDKFSYEQLFVLFRNDEKRQQLVETIGSLGVVQYNKLLDWLDKLVVKSGTESADWLNDFPFIRCTDGTTLSWNDIQSQPDVLLLDDRLATIGPVLRGLNFRRPLFIIDKEKHKNLANQLFHSSSYLTDANLLFSRLSNQCEQNAATLIPTQKVQLLTFLKDQVKGIGEAKYARELRLCCDRNSQAQPLSTLISSKIVLPPWIQSFQIMAEEEAVLESFGKDCLIQTGTLFDCFFCNSNRVSAMTKSLDSHHVAEWTSSLLEWFEKAERKPTEYKGDLNWIYTNEIDRFQPASKVWYNEALRKVSAASILQSLTGLLLPHVDSLPLLTNKELNLLRKTASVTDSIQHTDVILSEADARLLLSFLQEAGESKFLETWRLIEVTNGFQLVKINSRERVYAADNDLHSFIQNSSLKSVLFSVPVGLADHPAFSLLGAISGDTLLTLLAEKAATLSLAPILTKRGDTKLYTPFLQHLATLLLSSTATYTDSSPESHVLRIACDLPERETLPSAFATFLNNIQLDGMPLSELRDFTEKVSIEKPGMKEGYPFLTAELLPNNASRIERISKALAAFDGCKKVNKEFLRKTIFVSETLKADKASSEIYKSKPDYLSPIQLLFLQLHRQSKGGNHPNITHKTYHVYWSEQQNQEERWRGDEEYLTRLYEFGVTSSHINYGLEQYVTEADYCLKSVETLPKAFTKWANTADRLHFLTQITNAANGPNSTVVKLRKALLNKDNVTAKYNISELTNKQLLLNSILWLNEKQDNIIVTACVDSIGELLKKISWPIGQQPLIPVIDSITEGVKTYRLDEYASQPVHTWSETWKEYEQHIHEKLASSGALIVENSFPVDLDKLISKLDTITPDKRLAADILLGATLLTESCYEHWDQKANYPIYIINGNQIPWQVWYGDLEVATFEESDSFYDMSAKITYLTAKTAKSFPLYLPESFPPELKLELFELRDETLLNPSNLAEKMDYNATDEAIQSGREHSDKEQQTIYSEAVKRGRVSLEEDGFNFTNAEQTELGYFKNVGRPDSDELTEVYFRSAKGGLLYLNPGLWNRLDDPNLLLVVIYADGKPRYIESKLALLQGKYNDYLLVRMTNNELVQEADKLARQLTDENGHLLFVTGLEMQRNLAQEFEARKQNARTNAATASKYDL